MPKKNDKAAEAVATEEEVQLKKGKFIFKDGSTYEGEWKLKQPTEEEIAAVAENEEPPKPRKIREGQGKMERNGETYAGEWKEDLIHGKGLYCFASGDKYTGDFINQKFNGSGTFEWADGAKYIGEWCDNKMHGNGEFYSPSGGRWKGQFHNDTYEIETGHWLSVKQLEGFSQAEQ